MLVVIIHIFQRLSVLYPQIGSFGIISDWGNLGLVMFFVISGFLYSGRYIEKGKAGNWFARRYLELIIPALFTVIVTVSFFAVRGEVSRSRVIYSILSGLGMEAFVPNGWMFIQYWFLSYILICYLTVPLIQRIDFAGMSAFRFYGSVIAVTVAMQTVLSGIGLITSLPVLSWGVLLRFYLPYAVFRRYGIKTKECEHVMIAMTALSVVLIVAVCYIRYSMEPTGIWADLQELFFIYTQTIAGFALFYWLYRAFEHVQAHQRLIELTDSYSYPVYLTHCLFIGYSTSVIDKFDNRLLGIAVALICTAVASFIVLHVTKPIKKSVIGRLNK